MNSGDRAAPLRLAPWLALLIGMGSAFGFQPVGLWPLIPIAFAGLLEILWRTRGVGRAVLVGWMFAVGQFVVGLNWIATAFTFQAAMPAWLGWIAVVLLSFYLAAFLMLGIGVAWRVGRTNRLALVIALAGAWTLTDFLRSTMFTGFAWNPAAVALADTPWLKLAPMIGTYGLTILTVLIGGALWLLLRREWRAGGILAACLAAAMLWPSTTLRDGPSGVHLRVVQPNIGQDQKWQDGFGDVAAQRLAQLSLAPGGKHPRLLLWPEVAITQPLQDGRGGNAPLFTRFERMRAVSVLDRGDLLLTGGVGLASRNKPAISGSTNSVFVLDPAGRRLGRYDKAHLVPYGEYLPLRPLLSAIGLSQLAPGDGDTLFGPGPRTLTMPNGLKVGFQVCYEIIFSGDVIDQRDRPDMLFNPSNDAWFGRWGPPQHLAQARLRAAEEGIPVVRSTPTGISAIVDAHGRLLRVLPWKTAGVIDADMPMAAARPTLFSRTGNRLPLALAGLLVLTAVVMGVGARYKRI